MASFEDGLPTDVFYVCNERGCPVYEEEFDLSQPPPAPKATLPAATVLRVARRFEDQELRTMRPSLLPLSTVRGSRGSVDDVATMLPEYASAAGNNTNSAANNSAPNTAQQLLGSPGSYEGIPNLTFFRLLEPTPGYVLDTAVEPPRPSVGPSHYHAGEVVCRKGGLEESARWVYRVVCNDGALVRSGIELSSPQRCTSGVLVSGSYHPALNSRSGAIAPATDRMRSAVGLRAARRRSSALTS